MIIWKFPLEIIDSQEIEVPPLHRCLSVQIQQGTPCLWALVDDADKQRVQARIRVFGTGHPIDASITNLVFIDTFQVMQGSLVFHIFEQIR